MIEVGRGFIRLVDCMPKENCDKRIVNSARISYGHNKSKEFTDKDKKLLFFLMENRHTSPFEMVEFLFHVKAPIFVARQWFRHRTFSYNEVSARYTTVDSDFFVPDNVRVQSEKNFQQSYGSSNSLISNHFLNACNIESSILHKKYETFVEIGVPREQARIILPQNTITEFYCKGNLHNWLNFINLRDSDEAQEEIRVYAKEIKKIIGEKCPVSMEAYEDYRNGVSFSASELRVMNGETVNWSKRKIDKLSAKMKKINKKF
jgi:thymidylate synthase (FAD)